MEKKMEFKHIHPKEEKKGKEIQNRYNKEKAQSKRLDLNPNTPKLRFIVNRRNLFLQDNFRLHFFKRNYLLDTHKKI